MSYGMASRATASREKRAYSSLRGLSPRVRLGQAGFADLGDIQSSKSEDD